VSRPSQNGLGIEHTRHQSYNTNELKCNAIAFVSGRVIKLRLIRNNSHFLEVRFLHPFPGASARARTLTDRNKTEFANLDFRGVTPLTTGIGHARAGVALRNIFTSHLEAEVDSAISNDIYTRCKQAREPVKASYPKTWMKCRLWT